MFRTNGRWLLLFGLASGCDSADRPELEPTTPGLTVDTLASPAELPAQALSGGTVLPDGRLALADLRAGTVWLVGPVRGAPERLGTSGSGEGQISQPIGVTSFGDTIAVVSAGTARVDLFEHSGLHLGSLPLALALLSGPLELLPSGHALVATFGQDSALAALRTLSGATLTRFGSSLVPADQEIDPTAIKRSIRSGQVPGVFRDVVLPVGAPDGSVWVVMHTEGIIQRYGPDGVLLATATLPAAEVAPVREEFFRANTDPDQPGAIHAYLLTASGVADSAGAWFLLASPPDRSAVLIRIGNDGSIGERLVIAESRGARLLLRDLNRDVFYLVHQEDGVVVRIRRAGAP
ncbi:MAG: hypothetical protein SGI84_13475 [Gemmatimonadota bacterium]|nr:hypothetical protein [Gemmatimonadota bacterium]